MGVLRSSESAIALKVKVKALEKSYDAGNAVTAPLDRFDFVVQSFHETTAEPVNKVVDYFIQPVIERRQELVEAGQCTTADLISPLDQALFSLGFG